jgi:phosphatidylserine decarboxylase
VRLPIAREGWPFILPLLGLAVLGLALMPIGGWFFLASAAFVGYFFRDPERAIPADPELLLAPADGKIVAISPEMNGPEGTCGNLVSIFLSVFDVHINRVPVAGTVVDVRYQPGRFLPAFRPDASAANEQNIVTLQTGEAQVVVTQIAGILARRIVCRATAGDVVRAGQRFGLIRFGSRVDVLIPPQFSIHVGVGQRVRGGESILAAHRPQPVPAGQAAQVQPDHTLDSDTHNKGE